MMEAADRRQERTRTALLAAFRHLVLEHGYEALTIGAVTACANVGRSTFYEHYRTKDDLLRASIKGPFVRLADLVNNPADTGPLRNQLQHFRDNQQVARVLLGWPTRPVLASALAQLIAERLHALPKSQPLIPIELIARQIADAQLALLDSWIAGRPVFDMQSAIDALRVTADALVKALCRM
jgi:AcrR family transcriptional regulator